MGLTKDYQQIVCAGLCNAVNSSNGMIEAVDKVTCATSACECVNFYNLRTAELSDQIRRDKHQVTAFKFSPNKRFLAIGYDDGEVHLYDRKEKENGKPIIFDGHKRGVNTLAFSHDGFTLASGGKDSLIILWDILNESGKYRLNGHTDSITQLQFTKDDKYIVSSSKDTQVRFWDVSSHSCFYTISESISEIYGFALIKNDQMLIVGSAEVELVVYELNWLNQFKEDEENLDENEKDKNQKKRKLINEPLIGSELIEEDNDQGNTIIRSKRRGRLIRQAKGRALQLSVSRDEAIICVLGGDVIFDIFRVYDNEEAKKRLSKKLRKAKRKLETKDEQEDVTEAEIMKDVTLFVSRIGEHRSEAKMKWIDFTGEFSKKGDTAREYRLYGMQGNNTIHGITVSVDFKSNEVNSQSLANLDRRGHRKDVRCLTLAENNKMFVSGSSDAAIIWDLNYLLPMNRLEDESMKDILSALIVPGDKYAIFGTKLGSLFLFDLATCELVHEYKKAHDGGIWSLVSLPDKTGFVSVGSDKKAHFWQYQMVTEITTRILKLNQVRSTELEDEILCATISPNGRFIVFGLLNFTAKIHYLDSLKFFLSFYGHSLPVMCVDVDHESKLVVTGSSDKGCKIWGLDFGDCHKSLYGHSDAVTAVKFMTTTLDGVVEKLFFSAGKDGLIIQWDAVKFHKIQQLQGHFAEIRDMVLTSDYRTLISASNDKSIRIWEESGELVVLSEQESAEIEKDYLEKMIDAEDIVPGEGKDAEAELAAKKSVETIKGAETILEAVEIVRTENEQKAINPAHADHPLIAAYGSTSHDHFVLDAIHRVRPAHLERSLLMVPFGYVPEIVKALTKCIEDRYRIELATRILLFLFKIHHNYVSKSIHLFPLIDDLRLKIPTEIEETRDKIAYNAAALKLLKLQLEDRDNVKMFKDVSQIDGKGKKSKKKPGERVALIRAKV